MSNELLTREQAAIAEFRHEFTWLRTLAEDDFENRLVPVVDSFISAVGEFGQAEMQFRRAERRETLGIEADSAEQARRRGRLHHERGLRLLDRSLEATDRFLEDTDMYPRTGDVGEELKIFHEDFQRAVVDLDIKPSDVAKLDEAARQAIDVGSRYDVRELGDFISERLRKLGEVRRSEDRGTSENIPFWKVLAVAVALGIAVWAIFKCNWRWFGRRCTTVEGLGYVLAFKIAVLIWKLC